jgi:hypothetical protein
MDTARVRERAQAFIDALHTLEQADGDGAAEVGALVELYADDARLTNSALRLHDEERRGREGAREFWGEYKRTIGQGYSDFYQVAVNDQAAGLFWVTRIQADGKGETAYDGTSLLVFGDDGRIVHFQGYYDTRQLNHAVGAGEGGSPARR